MDRTETACENCGETAEVYDLAAGLLCRFCTADEIGFDPVTGMEVCEVVSIPVVAIDHV